MRHQALYRNLPHLFLRAREEVLYHFRPILKHHGLTEQQWRILRVLGERKELEQWEVAGICQILSPSLAGVLARMENQGIICRSRMPEDQRRVIVRLSAKGARLYADIVPLVQAQYEKLEQALGQELIDELYQAVDKLLAQPHPPVEHIDLPKRPSTRGKRGVARTHTPDGV
ncbi:MAG: homoprotocatechuate degradation operon regulator HpaR [Burkholderiaceae bacterium]|jgi:homoprotocatechuate degradation regulator HpaR|nr:homoprotocatechuate degradation operon regulator HpaR [Burkholderiaceae bacterium]